MQKSPSEDDLPTLEKQMLLSLWEARAIGNRAISIPSLKKSLTEDAKFHCISCLKNLEKKLFVEISRANEDQMVSITPLGLAFIRQIQDDDLRLVTGEG